MRRVNIPVIEDTSEDGDSEAEGGPHVREFCARVLRLETALRRERAMRKEMEVRLQRVERNTLRLMEERAVETGLPWRTQRKHHPPNA